MKRNDIRNVAIIAHVDHGKTTLVDQMMRQSGLFRESELRGECMLDSNDLEREPGITILAKRIATTALSSPSKDLHPLYDAILAHVPPPDVEPDKALQLLVTTLDWSDYVGRIGIGKVAAGKIRKGQKIALMKHDGRRVDDTVA